MRLTRFASRMNTAARWNSPARERCETCGIADAAERTVKANKPLTRSNLRDAIQATKMNTIQGAIAYDENGDITNRTVSVYQWADGKIKYVAVAPQQ